MRKKRDFVKSDIFFPILGTFLAQNTPFWLHMAREVGYFCVKKVVKMSFKKSDFIIQLQLVGQNILDYLGVPLNSLDRSGSSRFGAG